jgi:hypothetical protein
MQTFVPTGSTYALDDCLLQDNSPASTEVVEEWVIISTCNRNKSTAKEFQLEENLPKAQGIPTLLEENCLDELVKRKFNNQINEKSYNLITTRNLSNVTFLKLSPSSAVASFQRYGRQNHAPFGLN